MSTQGKPLFFVARWHEDPRYSLAEAHGGKLYSNEKLARRRADRLNEQAPELGRFGYVVRTTPGLLGDESGLVA